MLRRSDLKARSGRPPKLGWLALGLTLAALGLAACGDDDEDETRAETAPAIESNSSADQGEPSEKVVIRTKVDVDIPEGGPVPGKPIGGGAVLDGSSIGDSPFCAGGKFSDMHGNPGIGLVDRTFRCSGGRLRIGFTPGAPEGDTQAGPWKVVGGTGAFKGVQGDGQMKVTYEPGTDATKGRETFTGTAVR
jgi:hypothetical protein